MFIRGPSIGIRIIALALLTLVIIFLDLRLQILNPARSALSSLATPVYWVADAPSRLSNWGEEAMVSRNALVTENTELKQKMLVLSGLLAKQESLTAENTRLRTLLNSSAIVEDSVLMAELIGVSPDPRVHTVIINKGTQDNVYIGQPLIDANGLMGQVIEVGLTSSRVMLITDDSHAVPVQVNRNGVRAIIEGEGILTEVILPHVATTTDIKKGDLLETSGLGHVFPRGYPVAEVIQVTEDPGEHFLQITAKPLARLSQSRHVLLVFTGDKKENGALSLEDHTSIDVSVTELIENKEKIQGVTKGEVDAETPEE